MAITQTPLSVWQNAFEYDPSLIDSEAVKKFFNRRNLDFCIDTWADATKKAKDAGQSIGIYYDDHFISVPTVSAVISDGNCVINGMKDYDEATSLATFIRVGAINLQLEELESNVVGAQLGGTALTNAVKAAIIGIILIMIFMIVLYGILGVVASIGLALYSMLGADLLTLHEELNLSNT